MNLPHHNSAVSARLMTLALLASGLGLVTSSLLAANGPLTSRPLTPNPGGSNLTPILSAYLTAFLTRRGEQESVQPTKVGFVVQNGGVNLNRLPSSRPLTPNPGGTIRSLAVKSKSLEVVALSGVWQKTYNFTAGKTVEISVHLEHPAALPANGRVAVEWTLEGGPTEGFSAGILGAKPAAGQRKADAFGIYTQPTANWRKVLHALDGDIYLTYRAPVTGKYTLKLAPLVDETPIGDASPRWRERGSAPTLAALPRITPWPAGTIAPVGVLVKAIDLGTRAEEEKLHTLVACAPNDTPEQAQLIVLTPGSGENDVQTWEITGGADDVEFFDNGKIGKSGDDWFKLVYKGTEPRLLTAQLAMPTPLVAARIRAYKSPGVPSPNVLSPGVPAAAKETAKDTTKDKTPSANSQSSVPAAPAHSVVPGSSNAMPGVTSGNSLAPSLVDLVEIKDGQDGNERAHQQDEEHRANICRLLKPGDTYYLRVEANAPGYQLQLRLLKPAPYTDPRMAVRQAMYTQIGQVDAWLTNRPRGISNERRLRETGNLLGTGCMSCHTQSGVWGPAVPLTQGYRLENAQNYWHLIDVMYECLRPTNELKDAANNTSLAPLDLGDGPAGTRAAGFNIVNLERWRKPSRLHSKQQIRTANFVMLTGDPGGINAAGPGSNIGFVIVNSMATEILKTAWEQTGDPKYFRKMQEKARQVMAVNPQFTDDVALRLDYFHRLFPIRSYVAWAQKAALQESAEQTQPKPEQSKPAKVEIKVETPEESAAFVEKVTAQLAQDEARLRAIQQPDGSWNFSPGTTPDSGKTWKPGVGASDPSPTALGVTALTSAGYGKDDPSIARAVKALLAMQDVSGRWNRAAQTGFVSTAYALHALSRLYPEIARPITPNAVRVTAGESFLQTLARVRKMALTADPQFVNALLVAAKHDSPLIRYWAFLGLGATHTEKGASALAAGLGDRTKLARDAAAWGMRHTLLDDKGWTLTLDAAESPNDYTREAAWQALNMRADTVMPHARVNIARLTALFDRAMNRDPHPAVRAWAIKAAWQWWIWNPPVRKAMNQSWVRLLERPEPNAEVDNSARYSEQMLFIANGHKANGSKDQQYKELATLFADLIKRLDTDDEVTKARLARRLVGIGGTFFTMAGGDGGPGQMGYVTDGAGEMMGKASLVFLASATKEMPLTEAVKPGANLALLRAGLEGGANVPYTPLTAFLVDYSIKGPDELRKLAASAISDPRTVSVAAVPELVEPQLAQVKRGAMEPPRRDQISDPIIDLWSRVNWVVPKREEQQRAFFDLMIPQFPQYVSAAQIAAIADPAQRSQVQRDMDAAWYMADRLGFVLATNPDLHQEIVLRHYFPTAFKNPLEELFWTRSVEWMLTFTPTPATPAKSARAKMTKPRAVRLEPVMPALFRRRYAVCQQPDSKTITAVPDGKKPLSIAPDPTLIVKDRALQLYLDQLKSTANPKTRAIAIRMANQTALRTNPEVLRSLNEALAFEKDPELVTLIQNVLKQSDSLFLPELMTALKAEKHASIKFDAKGEPALTDTQKQDILYFRDYLLPELTRQKRTDQQSCMGCHGVPGRVPSLQLRAPDKFGFLPVSDMLVDYRILQQRVNITDIEKSKILRKPLNIQDGKEDGHQGGRRYSPNDPGYLLIRKWVEDQSKVQTR